MAAYSPPQRVFIVSPYAGDVEANKAYARACVRDSISRGEAPFAPHLMYPEVLDDRDPAQRGLGMALGHVWLQQCDVVAVYRDHDISPGMHADIHIADKNGIPISLRTYKGAEGMLAWAYE